MLPGIGIQAAKNIRCSRFLELDCGNQAWDIPAGLVFILAGLKDIECLLFQVFNPGGIRRPQQMCRGKMDIGFYHIIAHQSVNHIGAPPVGDSMKKHQTYIRTEKRRKRSERQGKVSRER